MSHFQLTADDFREVRGRIGRHIHRTPLLSSRILSERTGCEVRLKAELFKLQAAPAWKLQ